MNRAHEIIDVKYNWDNDTWDLVVYAYTNVKFVRSYENEHLAESGKKFLLKKLASIKDGNVEDALIKFGMTIIRGGRGT